MESYLIQANLPTVYIAVAALLLFVAFFCFLFIFRSYKAGIKMGMDRKVLKKTIVSAATFTAIPSISILLGVIALAGSLGVPMSWLRLSVIGNLQYEATVAQIAAEGMGKTLSSSVLNMDDLVTILLVMTVGIIWGCIFTLLTLKPYTRKLQSRSKINIENKKPSFANLAMVAMFIGLCAAFVGNYLADFIVNGIKIPILCAIVSAIVMAIFEYLIKQKKHKSLESFSLALSMIIAMTAAAFMARFIGA